MSVAFLTYEWSKSKSLYVWKIVDIHLNQYKEERKDKKFFLSSFIMAKFIIFAPNTENKFYYIKNRHLI